MCFWKMFIQQQQKLLTNIDGYITAVKEIEPYNFSSSVFIMAAIFIFSEWLNLNFMVKSTVGKGIVKLFFRIVKDGFIRWQFIYISRILSGKFFIMLGGWLEFTFMYNGLLSGLLYGLVLLLIIVCQGWIK